MLSMTAIAIIICTLTSRIKLQALEAEQREQNTKALYELNERLNQEKNAIQLEAPGRPSAAISFAPSPTTSAPL